MELAVEDCLPVRAEGFDEDVFDGLVVLVTSVQLAAALRLAQMDPVGGAIAGALEARRFAERFQQNGTLAVALLPVVGELSLQAGEQVGRQRGETDPGQDEIAGVIDDQGQVAVAEILAALPDESDFARQVVVYLVSVWNVRRSTLSAVAEAAKPGRGEAMVGQVVQELLDEGKTEGRTEGRAEGRADSLTELLEHRFGQLPEAVLSLIASASQAELVTWFKAALDATSLVAVFEGHALD